MPIYTRTGDKGQTSLYGGKRISKSSPRVEAYGSVDELTSFIGLVISHLESKDDKKILTRVQKDLYYIMSFLSGAPPELNDLESSIREFEKRIDKMEAKLPPLRRFILPQGTELSSWFHILRVVCRKAERKVVVCFKTLEIGHWDLEIVKYFNRLSDLFFIYARWYNKGKEIKT